MRRCYRSEWRLFRDDLSKTTPGYYYWAEPDAPFVNFPHYLWSGRHLASPRVNEDLGEVSPIRRRWMSGALAVPAPPPVPVGGETCEGFTGLATDQAEAPLISGVDARCWLNVGLPPPAWEPIVQTPTYIPVFTDVTGQLTDSPLSVVPGGCVTSDICFDALQLREGGVAISALYASFSYVSVYVSAALAPYLTQASAILLYEPIGAAASSMAAHLAAADPHPVYLREAEADLLYDYLGAAADELAAHVALADPHSQYLTLADGDAEYDPLGAAADEVDVHEADPNPHPQYLTPAEGDAAYDPIGEAEDEVDAHEAAADPHPQYLTSTEADLLYAPVGGGGRTEGTLAAAGSTQGDAALITTDAVEVSGADGTKGVMLRNVAAGIIAVRNTHGSNSLKVYPPSGALIRGFATNAPHTLFGGGFGVYIRSSSGYWAVHSIL